MDVTHSLIWFKKSLYIPTKNYRCVVAQTNIMFKIMLTPSESYVQPDVCFGYEYAKYLSELIK